MVDLPRHFVEIQHYLNKIHKPFVESSTLKKLVEQAFRQGLSEPGEHHVECISKLVIVFPQVDQRLALQDA